MIFLKRSHYDSRRSGKNRPSGDRDGAQGTRYTLEKQVFVQASHAEQSWQVPFTPKDSFAAAAQESARACKNSWQQANITVTGDLMSQKLLRIHSYHLPGFGFAF